MIEGEDDYFIPQIELCDVCLKKIQEMLKGDKDATE